MKIAVINEFSARDKNPLIIEALQKTGAQIFNVGMTPEETAVNLTYIHTSLMAAAALNSGAADFVVGGCGTGQGFAIAVMQYPNVFCGLIVDPLDAWLFGKINGGNCVSLPLNKGFGWGGGINLEIVFEQLFSPGFAEGYPPERKEVQKESRDRLQVLSELAHRPFPEILAGIDTEITDVVFSHKPFTEFILKQGSDPDIQKIFQQHC